MSLEACVFSSDTGCAANVYTFIAQNLQKYCFQSSLDYISSP